MILYTCKCLNFMIEANDTVEPVDSAIKFALSSRAQKQELVLVTYETITKRIDILVGLSRQDGWTEFHCRNCTMWVYTCRTRESDPSESKIIVNKSAMITHPEVEKLKEGDKYSQIFQIVLCHDSSDDLFSGSPDPLHPIAAYWLQEQTELAEACIKNFAELRYAELEKKRLQAHSDQSSIRRAMATDNAHQTPIQYSFADLSMPVTPAKRVPKMVLPGSSSPTDSFLDLDESLLFEFKTSHDSVLSEGSDDDIVDLPQPRRALEPMAMARSLPIPVPQFLEERRHDDRLEKSPQTPTDIAANIKALARSIHGNPVFGELPRPRFTKD